MDSCGMSGGGVMHPEDFALLPCLGKLRIHLPHDGKKTPFSYEARILCYDEKITKGIESFRATTAAKLLISP